MSSRGGAVVAGVWLIGLGLIFLVREWTQLSWGEAWPLFIILVGVASLVTALIGRRSTAARAWQLLWPLAWIAVGVVLLLSTTGQLAISPAQLIANGWPIVLVGIGVWFLVAAFLNRDEPTQSVQVLLSPTVQEAHVRLAFGGGSLWVERGPDGTLVGGTFTSGVDVKERGPGDVALTPKGAGSAWLPWDRPIEWRVGLTGEIPIDLRVEGGAYRGSLDLSDLLVRSLDIRTGASETHVMLPRGAGLTQVRAESGAASLTIRVPDGVAARVRSRMSLGNVSVDESRFPRAPDGWASSDWETATNRAEISIEGGVGSVRVT